MPSYRKISSYFPWIVAAISLTLSATKPAEARVQKILRMDGDVGDSLPSALTLGQGSFYAMLDDGNGDQVATVHWTAVATLDGCTKNYELGNRPMIQLYLNSLGTVTLKADITYQQNPTMPPSTPDPNSVNATITISPPSGFTMIPFDQTLEYNIGGEGNAKIVQFQVLQSSGFDDAGYYLTPVEKISYIIPAGADPEWNGNWGGNAPFLTIYAMNGTISDNKGIIFDKWPEVGLGQILMQYTQTIGVKYTDWCGGDHVISLGTVTVTHTRSGTDFNKWKLTATQP